MRYSRVKMMRNIQTLAFNLHEVVLYLDVHPKCQKALDFYKVYKEKLDCAVKEYESAFGPITYRGNEDCAEWTWIKGPWPWQYEANFCHDGAKEVY